MGSALTLGSVRIKLNYRTFNWYLPRTGELLGMGKSPHLSFQRVGVEGRVEIVFPFSSSNNNDNNAIVIECIIIHAYIIINILLLILLLLLTADWVWFQKGLGSGNELESQRGRVRGTLGIGPPSTDDSWKPDRTDNGSRSPKSPKAWSC